ncbi:MAG: methyltransferase [Bacteroidota bacterium]
MRGLLRKMVQPLLWKGYRWYLRKKRWYHHDGLAICIYPSVFHPGWLGTTKNLLHFIRSLELKNKQMLELGAGSGLLSLWASRAGARVTASDINPLAIQSIQESAQRNQLSLTVIHSDLFTAIPPQVFDVMLINPPFYPQQPQNDRERAFFCGPNFEYFHQLFATIQSYLAPQAEVYMILTDDCDLKTIGDLAKQSAIQMTLKEKGTHWQEEHLVYQLVFTERGEQ